jgi:hypothetical protein
MVLNCSVQPYRKITPGLVMRRSGETPGIVVSLEQTGLFR